MKVQVNEKEMNFENIYLHFNANVKFKGKSKGYCTTKLNIPEGHHNFITPESRVRKN